MLSGVQGYGSEAASFTFNILEFLPQYAEDCSLVELAVGTRARIRPGIHMCSVHKHCIFCPPLLYPHSHILAIPGSKFSVDLQRIRENDKHSKAPSTRRFVCKSGDSMAYTQIPRVFVFCLLRMNLNNFLPPRCTVV